MARKIKLKDEEREFEDDVAEYLADETGVPFRNRAAEWRRKHEKAEKEAEKYRAELEEARKAKPAPAAPLYQPGVYDAPRPQASQQGMSADEIRALARAEAARLREEEEYEREQAKLREEWPDYEEHEAEVVSYLREKGYSEEQFRGFGPRDKRLVRDAFENYRNSKKPAGSRRRSPQEVVLDTGGGAEMEEPGSPWDKDPAYWDKRPKSEFLEHMNSVMMKSGQNDE